MKTDNVLGCLLGGAIGDALGAPVEFLSRDEIRQRFGARMLTGFHPVYGRCGSITDDTQMTLFTVEGLIQGLRHAESADMDALRINVHRSYLRWLQTQGETSKFPIEQIASNALLDDRRLFAIRAPGTTCIRSLKQTLTIGSPASNASKGCGSVMRSAPFGFLPLPAGAIFQLAADCSRLTHGHADAAHASGAFAVLIHELSTGLPLQTALSRALNCLLSHSADHDLNRKLSEAIALAQRYGPEIDVERLGEGWVADEALAISIACAVAAPGDPEQALMLAVNHSGDSDSTGSICGNIVGTLYGASALLEDWCKSVELSDLIEVQAEKLEKLRLQLIMR